MKNLSKSEMKVVSTILAHVEKNCSEVEEVEDFLWSILERQEDDVDRCSNCKEFLYEGNTSASSIHIGLCHTCENDMNS